MKPELAVIRYSRKDIRLADEAQAALIRGDRKALRDPSGMPLAVVQRLGFHLWHEGNLEEIAGVLA